MNLENMGRLLVIVGLVLAVTGGLIWALSKLFGGSFPGTIKIQTSGITCIFPLLASIVISIVLTVVLNLVLKLLNK